MSRIRIENFGPLKKGFLLNSGWLEVKKVTVFTGNQGSGKSTVAKLISTFTWIEKAMMKGTMKEDWLNSYNRFVKQCEYHNISSYFSPKSVLEYQGEGYVFKYKNGRFNAQRKKDGDYSLPKILYIPAERNFVAAVDQAEKLRYLPKSLVTFLDEYKYALRKLKKRFDLPINNTSLKVENGVPFISGEGYNIRLSEASSGFQSSAPLCLVAMDLAKLVKEGVDPSMRELSSKEMTKLRSEIKRILMNNRISDEIKNESLRLLSIKYKTERFFAIVEEPEQNLFPTSQRDIINYLLSLINMNPSNSAVITTHSPYLINYLTLAIKANSIKITKKHNQVHLTKLNSIVPINSSISSNDVAIYELNERNGTIMPLGEFNGIPSDQNYLNLFLQEGNKLYDELLDIEEAL